MKLYVDGEKTKTTKPVESTESLSGEVLDSSGARLDAYGQSGFKSVKIYVDGGEKKTTEATERSSGMSGGRLDSYGSSGFRSVTFNSKQDQERRSTASGKTPSWTVPDPAPLQPRKIEEKSEIPVIRDDNLHAGKSAKLDTGKLTTIVALLVAACVCVIVFAFSGTHSAGGSPEIANPTTLATAAPESTAPALPFSDDPTAIDAASESVVRLEAYDKNGQWLSLGSGFACFADNVLVTNYHVIDGGEYIVATTEDGRTFNIINSKSYPELDVAILITDTPHNLTLLQPGDSTDLLKGEKVIAIGNPEGFDNSVSNGVFSGNRDIDGVNYLIQFTAFVTHGSSGGALFNDAGEVIGITTGGWEEGLDINFAVPIELAATLYDEAIYAK